MPTDTPTQTPTPTPEGSIGDTVWFDYNGNGVQDPGEPGLQNISVTLTGGPSPVTLGTDPFGHFLFTRVPAGSYTVSVDASDPDLPPGAVITTPQSVLVTLGAGEFDPDADFGFRVPPAAGGAIGDYVWNDWRGNGVHETGEPGIEGVTIELWNGGVIAAQTITDAVGHYLFEGLAAGTYEVRVTDTHGVLAGLTHTLGPDSKPAPYTYTLAENEVYLGSDFGYYREPVLADIGDFVWNDLNGDGVIDAGEQGIAGVTIDLKDGGGAMISTTTTDPYGYYRFDGLGAGTYTVVVTDTAHKLRNYDATTPISVTRTLNGQEAKYDADFGYEKLWPDPILGTIGDTFWKDVNRNRIIDPGEETIPGICVLLKDGNPQGGGKGDGPLDDIIATCCSDALGHYIFEDLPAGNYILEVDPNTIPAGLELTTANNPLSMALGAGEKYVRGDFGYAQGGGATPTPTATPSHPTVVLLSNFRAVEENNRVVVQWETGSEVGTVGFNLLRAIGAGGDYRQVNDRLLTGLLLSPQGGAYRFVDPTAKPGGNYSYKLVEIESNGTMTTHGPFGVQKSTGAKNTTSRLSAAGSRAMAKSYEKSPRGAAVRQTATLLTAQDAAAPARAAAASQGTGTRVRIIVREKGVYSVSDAQISPFFGLSAEEVRALIGSGQLHLSSGGHSVAYLPAAGNAGIIFYGEEMDSVYTDENVYWLERGEGLQMAHLPGTPPVPAGGDLTFTDTVHVEEDLCALTSLFNDPRADYWAWAYVVSGDANTGTRNFTVAIQGVASVPDTATLIVHLKGGSSSAAMPDHHARVSLNGAAIGECQWDGTEAHDARFSFDQTALRDGANTVTVTGLLDTGAPYSIFHVDSFDLTYRRYYRAAGDVLHCKGGENAVATVSGFSMPVLQVMDISAPAGPKVLDGKTIDGAAGNYRISFAPASPAVPYCAFAPGAVRAPDSVAAGGDSDLKNPGNRADYLIITTDELKGAAQALAAYRGGQGLETMVVTFREIIDEFNDGISSPEAIRAFLSHAHQHWARAPRYVVIAGAGTYDYKNRLGYGGNLIPPLMVSVPHGLVASDTVLGDVEGDDGIPEIAVGRLPAVTSQELQGIIDKIIAYEAAVDDPWLSRVIMLADNPDIAGDFTSDSDAILDLIPADLAADEIYLSETTASEARQRLLASLNSGAILLNYFGHAGLDRLAQEALLMMSDVPSLANGEKLPFVTAMTCAMGNFSVPGYDCLAETLVLKSGGGAIGVWGPTGLSVDAEARPLDEAFYRAAFWGDNGEYILGDIVLDAEKSYGAAGLPRATVALYNILGDPALRLQWAGGSALSSDRDGDGLSDEDEALYGTDPAKADTDGDGFSDLMEIIAGSDPRRADSKPGSLRINFQPAALTPPASFTLDSGVRFTRGRLCGWR